MFDRDVQRPLLRLLFAAYITLHASDECNYVASACSTMMSFTMSEPPQRTYGALVADGLPIPYGMEGII